MTYTYEDWVRVANSPGSVSSIEHQFWMDKGCPRETCPGTSWDVTSDGWAYCRECGKGFSTWGIYPPRLVSIYAEGRYHCGYCAGYGQHRGDPCPDCDGQVTREEKEIA
jgi:DnaJ-class molecular chaperone